MYLYFYDLPSNESEALVMGDVVKLVQRHWVVPIVLSMLRVAIYPIVDASACDIVGQLDGECAVNEAGHSLNMFTR